MVIEIVVLCNSVVVNSCRCFAEWRREWSVFRIVHTREAPGLGEGAVVQSRVAPGQDGYGAEKESEKLRENERERKSENERERENERARETERDTHTKRERERERERWYGAKTAAGTAEPCPWLNGIRQRRKFAEAGSALSRARHFTFQDWSPLSR